MFYYLCHTLVMHLYDYISFRINPQRYNQQIYFKMTVFSFQKKNKETFQFLSGVNKQLNEECYGAFKERKPLPLKNVKLY